MARGKPLSNVEKYAIKAMVEEGMSSGQIAKKIARDESTIRKYVDANLKIAKELVAKERGLIPEEVEQALYKRLLEAGMVEVDAMSCIKQAKKKLTQEVTLDNIEALASWCFNRVGPAKLFVRQSEGGRKGVTIMSRGASEVLDELKSQRRKKNVDDHIFKQEHAVPKINDDDNDIVL